MAPPVHSDYKLGADTTGGLQLLDSYIEHLTMHLQAAVVFAILALVSGAPHGTALRRLESLLQEIAKEKQNTHLARSKYLIFFSYTICISHLTEDGEYIRPRITDDREHVPTWCD